MTNQSVGFCFFKSNACGSSSGNVPILRQGSVVFSTMSLLLGLDAGGARHVLPDPGRLPSSHQGQKIHRLLLGIPFPGSPLGTARYLVKTTRFSFFKKELGRHFKQFTGPVSAPQEVLHSIFRSRLSTCTASEAPADD